MRSCASAAAAASFKLFPASPDSHSRRVSYIHGVESHIGFLRFRGIRDGNPPNSGLLIRNRVLTPVVSASVSQVELVLADQDNLQLQLPDKDSSWMVHIRLQLRRKCRFGEQFVVVGDHPTLGMWDPLDAAPMVWSNGHVWTAELDLPAGQLIQFKFILREISGKIRWQPGPNRVLQTSDKIRVFGEWEDVTVQHVREENGIDNQCGESDEVMMIEEMRKLREYGDVASSDGQAMAMVAENITYHTVEDGGYPSKKLQVERAVEIFGNGVEASPALVPGLSPSLDMVTEQKIDQT